MVFVPAGPVAAGGPAGPAFLVGTGEVTCVEYSEWLDELEEADRRARVPSRGFTEDPQAHGRFLVVPEYEDRGVTGIRPADMQAYAAWRTEVFGSELRLATEEEWQRAAGSALLDPAWAPFFRPARAAPDGEGLAPDASPFGAAGLLTAPPEVVLRGGTPVVKAEGPGPGVAPAAAALAAGREVSPSDVVDAGFRLVQPLR
jgi:hypothetical protein